MFFKYFQPLQLDGGQVTNIKTVGIVVGVTAANFGALFVIAYVAGMGLKMGLGL